MFISVLFIMTKRWKQLKYSPTDELVNKKCVYSPYNGILFSPKRERSADT